MRRQFYHWFMTRHIKLMPRELTLIVNIQIVCVDLPENQQETQKIKRFPIQDQDNIEYQVSSESTSHLKDPIKTNKFTYSF